MRRLRLGLVGLLAGVVMVAGLVGSPPVVGAGVGLGGSAPQVVSAAASAAVGSVLPLARKKTPTVVFTSTLKLVVDVNPDLPRAKYWKIKLQRKSGRKWRTVGVYRTQGATETRAFGVKAGTYRVKVYARPGYRSVTTAAYTFTPTAPAPPAPPPDTTAPGVVTGLALVGRSATSISLAWTNPGDVDLAAVIVRRAVGGTAPVTAGDGAAVPLASATATSVTDPALAVSTIYAYAVFTRDATGNTSPGVALATSTSGASIQDVQRVSVASSGAEANGEVGWLGPDVSADGRWVVYDSIASNLVLGDGNGFRDVFLFDTVGRTTQRVSVAPTHWAEANGDSYESVISADGRWIAYTSDASNLVAGDGNGVTDVFMLDRAGFTTQRVSVASSGAEGNGPSYAPAISADGRWVTYASDASNLVAGDGNAAPDVFLFDTVGRTTQRVSVASSGAEGNGSSLQSVISADGRWVAYASNASNLVAGDGNAAPDVFLFDTVGRTTQRVSVASSGAEGNGTSYAPAISADGRWIAYASQASNLVAGDGNGFSDVFVFDTVGRTPLRVSVASGGLPANGDAEWPVISGDGRWIAYCSNASNLVAGDGNGFRDVFVFDTVGRTTQRVSVASSGAEGNGFSHHPAISADGRWIAYNSSASSLVGGDGNGTADVFLTQMW